MNPDHFYVTTPIYYVNDVPHIGHAYTTMLADVLSRYYRLLGVPTHFLTGTDEHGQKVHDAALKAGITAQEQADRTVVRFIETWKKLGIANDDFIRTTEPRHTEVVQEILTRLYEEGEIYRGEYEGWYCVSEERFYTEKELVDGKSPEGKPVEKIVEANYFFKMSKYQDWLIQYIEDHPEFIQPDFRRNETMGFLKKELGDLCISRPKKRLPWGVELPWDQDFVCYVWFDALVNYISAIGYQRDDERFAKWWPASYHLIGKDILTTHTVYWPTMMKAMGIEMPRTIFAHGWWLVGGEKMSKSVGNVTDPMQIMDLYGVDSLRYYLMAEMSLGQDATFTGDNFVKRYNSDLANDLGNLGSRVLKMISKNFGGVIPTPGEFTEADMGLRDHCFGAVEAMEERVASMSLDKGIARVIESVREANRYFDKMAPWTLAKKGELDRLGTVLYATAECLRIVTGLLYPVIPEKMAQLRVSLGLKDDEVEPHLAGLKEWGQLPVGRPLGSIDPLFPRIDTKKPAKEEQKPEGVALIDIDTFFNTQLRVAKILTAEAVPKAKRLLRLEISLGDEERQLVAGIAEHYTPEELVGKSVVVVANLKAAKIRGVESQGMVLAASAGKVVKLVTVDGDIPPGSSVG
jgi:methionyl-tRNA synthetase